MTHRVVEQKLPAAILANIRLLLAAGLITACASLSAAVPSESEPENTPAKQLELRINLLESNQGAYSLQLGEALTTLADYHASQHEFEQASKHYNRALHIERINQGIYSAQQKPILEKLVSSLQAQNKWPSAIKKQQYAHWLSNRQHPQDSLELLTDLHDLANWHIAAYVETDKRNHQHLIEAHKLYRQYIELNDSHHNNNHLRLIPILKGFMNTNYFLASSVEKQESGFNIKFSSQEQLVERQEKIAQYKMNSFRKGKLALERMIKIYSHNSEDDASSEIKTLIALGDWYQLYGKSQSAKVAYLKAYQKAATEPSNADALFAIPVALPVLDKGLYKNSAQHHSYSIARFDVASNGSAKNIEILETMPAKGKRLGSKTKRFLRSTRFRPVMKAGRVVAAKNVTQRYSFP